MTDYIKREDALNASKIVYIEYIAVDDEGYEDGDADDIPCVFKADIEKIPAADVRENVHAHWVRPTIINGRSFDILHCSACGGVPCGVDKSTKFCACCGAIMDGGDEQ